MPPSLSASVLPPLCPDSDKIWEEGEISLWLKSTYNNDLKRYFPWFSKMSPAHEVWNADRTEQNQSWPRWAHIRDWRWQVRERVPTKGAKMTRRPNPPGAATTTPNARAQRGLHARSWMQMFQSCFPALSLTHRSMLQTPGTSDTLLLRTNWFLGKRLGDAGNRSLLTSPPACQELARRW